MPITVTVLASLGLIVLISRFHKNLVYAVLIATLFLAFSCGYSVSDILNIAWYRISSANNMFLMLVIIQIIWLSQQMKDCGVMNDLVITMQQSISKKASMAVLPALIGILPMPGGALFSAPLVDDCDTKSEFDPLLKTKINYWFRHIWEYWWPLYPGVLLVIDITGISMLHFILLQIPLTLASVIIGAFVLLRKIKSDDARSHKFQWHQLRRVVILMSPVILLITIFVLIKLFLPEINEFNKFLPIAIGITAAILFLQLKKPLKVDVWKKNIFSMRLFKLFMLVEVIRVFGAFIEAKLPNGTYMAAQMHSELADWGIPILLVIMLIPFLTALTTGIAIGYVGASFPIIMTLIGSDPSQTKLYTTIVLAYGCGYIGLLLSPVHVCLIVTNEHFKTSLSGSLRRLLFPVSILFVVLIIYCLLLNYIKI